MNMIMLICRDEAKMIEGREVPLVRTRRTQSQRYHFKVIAHFQQQVYQTKSPTDTISELSSMTRKCCDRPKSCASMTAYWGWSF